MEHPQCVRCKQEISDREADAGYVCDGCHYHTYFNTVRACDMPTQPGDKKPVDPTKPDGVQWGQLFGRPRVVS